MLNISEWDLVMSKRKIMIQRENFFYNCAKFHPLAKHGSAWELHYITYELIIYIIKESHGYY